MLPLFLSSNFGYGTASNIICSKIFRQFDGVLRIDSVLVMFNWVGLLGASLLPFTAGTAVNAQANADGQSKVQYIMEAPFYINIVFIAASQFLFSAWIFFKLKKSRRFEYALRKRDKRHTITRMAETLVFFLVSVLALVVSQGGFGAEYAGKAFLLFVVLLPCLVFIKTIRGSTDSYLGYYSGITKARLEAFVDGVVAICATLIVLNVRPQKSCQDLTDPLSCLAHYSDGCRSGVKLDKLAFSCSFDYESSFQKSFLMIISYIVCFSIVNILWSIHETIYDKVTSKISGFALVLNMHFILFLSLMPYGTNLITLYALKPMIAEATDTDTDYELDKGAAATACAFVTGCLLAASSMLGLLSYVHKRQPRNLAEKIKIWNIPIIAIFTMALISFDDSEGNSLRQRIKFLLPIAIMPLVHLLCTFLESLPNSNDDDYEELTDNE